MIKLYQFARVWGIPNLSPFCCKVETYLRMAGIPYEVVDATPSGPTGKLPYIEDDGHKISDSRLIVEYLKSQHNADLDRALTASERAQSIAFQRLIEDDLHWAVIMWPRWNQTDEHWQINKQAIFGSIPPIVRDLVAWGARRYIRKQIWGQGVSRISEDQIFALAKTGITALSDFLADKTYFFGSEPSTLDASAFGLLSILLWSPVEIPPKTQAQHFTNLVAYCDKIRDRYFMKPDLATNG